MSMIELRQAGNEVQCFMDDQFIGAIENAPDGRFIAIGYDRSTIKTVRNRRDAMNKIEEFFKKRDTEQTAKVAK